MRVCVEEIVGNDNTQGAAEPSLASAGSHGERVRAAFERFADEWGLRISKRLSGRYVDSSTQWAWTGWRGAAITDAERDAVEFFAEACKWWSSKDGQAHVATIRGLLDRTK
jgi:hypothetical protein